MTLSIAELEGYDEFTLPDNEIYVGAYCAGFVAGLRGDSLKDNPHNVSATLWATIAFEESEEWCRGCCDGLSARGE